MMKKKHVFDRSWNAFRVSGAQGPPLPAIHGAKRFLYIHLGKGPGESIKTALFDSSGASTSSWLATQKKWCAMSRLEKLPDFARGSTVLDAFGLCDSTWWHVHCTNRGWEFHCLQHRTALVDSIVSTPQSMAPQLSCEPLPGVEKFWDVLWTEKWKCGNFFPSHQQSPSQVYLIRRNYIREKADGASTKTAAESAMPMTPPKRHHLRIKRKDRCAKHLRRLKMSKNMVHQSGRLAQFMDVLMMKMMTRGDFGVSIIIQTCHS